MTIPLFDIRIDTETTPGTAHIEILSGGPDAPKGSRKTLAVKQVPNRGDIPGDPGLRRYNTGAPNSMAQFAMLPDWVRNDALETLSEAFVRVPDRPSDYTTH